MGRAPDDVAKEGRDEDGIEADGNNGDGEELGPLGGKAGDGRVRLEDEGAIDLRVALEEHKGDLTEVDVGQVADEEQGVD